MSKSKCCSKEILVEVSPKYNQRGDMIAMKRERFVCSKCYRPIKDNKHVV